MRLKALVIVCRCGHEWAESDPADVYVCPAEPFNRPACDTCCPECFDENSLWLDEFDDGSAQDGEGDNEE